MATAENIETGSNGKRRLFIIVVLLVFIAGGAAYGAWWALRGRFIETTDDAYVGGNLVQITPQIAGTVTGIGADETEFVKVGQPLVEMDKADGRVALDQAEAQLGVTVRQITNLQSTSDERESAVSMRRAELERAHADVARARDDLERREKTAASGAVSKEETEHARAALAAAQAAEGAAKAEVEAAQRALVSEQALTRGVNVDTHPQVLSAAARVREAYLNYARTTLIAPVSGVVAKRSVQLGQRVAPGAPLMTVVPLDSLWVDANFKEVQLGNLRVGQPVKLRSDLYGGDVEFHGKIIGFAAGTGSSFALLPPQNATGNWIKVVQRVPVRIALDPAELAKYPLQLGLSMEVEADTHDRGGQRLPQVTRPAPAAAQPGEGPGQAGAAPGATQPGAAQPGMQMAGDSALMAVASQRVAAIIKANR
jgi:membrane fusion protein (multidrug efflux system)